MRSFSRLRFATHENQCISSENKSEDLRKLIGCSITATANGNTTYNPPKMRANRRSNSAGEVLCVLWEERNRATTAPRMKCRGYVLLYCYLRSCICVYIYVCIVVFACSYFIWQWNCLISKNVGYFPRFLAPLTSCDFIKACLCLKLKILDMSVSGEGWGGKWQVALPNVIRSSNSHSFN